MSSDEMKSNYNSGPGFASLLTIAFIVLKLCHVVPWSWWWVVSPLWISFIVTALMCVILVAVEVIKEN